MQTRRSRVSIDPIVWSADKFKLKMLENDFINFALEAGDWRTRKKHYNITQLSCSHSAAGRDKEARHMRRDTCSSELNWYLYAWRLHGFWCDKSKATGYYCLSSGGCRQTPFSLAFWAARAFGRRAHAARREVVAFGSGSAGMACVINIDYRNQEPMSARMIGWYCILNNNNRKKTIDFYVKFCLWNYVITLKCRNDLTVDNH